MKNFITERQGASINEAGRCLLARPLQLFRAYITCSACIMINVDVVTAVPVPLQTDPAAALLMRSHDMHLMTAHDLSALHGIARPTHFDNKHPHGPEYFFWIPYWAQNPSS